MITQLSGRSIDTMTYMILRLSSAGCPSFYDTSFYEELKEFALFLDDADEEEKNFVRMVIREELENGSYLQEHDEVFSCFQDAVSYFFSGRRDFELRSIWFGQTLCEEIERIEASENG